MDHPGHEATADAATLASGLALPLDVTLSGEGLCLLFADEGAAERFLEGRGFSVGRMQRGALRGVLYGDFDIQKWRNLRPADRNGLHGVLNAPERSGRAFVKFYGCLPADGRRALANTPTPAGQMGRAPFAAQTVDDKPGMHNQ